MNALVKAERKPGLTLQQVPDPKPGPGDVVIRVKATSLCGTDAHFNLRTIQAIPLRILVPEGAEAPELLEVRGEIYFPLEGFRRFNEAQLALGRKPAPNAATPLPARSGSSTLR